MREEAQLQHRGGEVVVHSHVYSFPLDLELLASFEEDVQYHSGRAPKRAFDPLPQLDVPLETGVHHAQVAVSRPTAHSPDLDTCWAGRWCADVGCDHLFQLLIAVALRCLRVGDIETNTEE